MQTKQRESQSAGSVLPSSPRQRSSVLNYTTAILTVSSMTTGDTPAQFSKFLNKYAQGGWAFRYAIKINDLSYLMIFEKVAM